MLRCVFRTWSFTKHVFLGVVVTAYLSLVAGNIAELYVSVAIGPNSFLSHVQAAIGKGAALNLDWRPATVSFWRGLNITDAGDSFETKT